MEPVDPELFQPFIAALREKHAGGIPHLNARQQTALEMRDAGCTFVQIGRHLGVSGTRAQQIYRNAAKRVGRLVYVGRVPYSSAGQPPDFKEWERQLQAGISSRLRRYREQQALQGWRRQRVVEPVRSPVVTHAPCSLIEEWAARTLVSILHRI